jgi:hypothetical protein
MAAKLLREKWEFAGYNESGEYEYAPPDKKSITN